MLSHVAHMETEQQYMGFVVDCGVVRFFGHQGQVVRMDISPTQIKIKKMKSFILFG